MIQLIKNYTQENLDEIIKIRRHLHMYPELSSEEVKTSQFIKNYLEKLNAFEIKEIGKTSLIAIIKGSQKGPTIALRADMDALCLYEEIQTIYTSKNKGIMHACGHDAHMATLLGVAKNLVKFKDKIKGTIILIFQAAEEIGGGAQEIIASSFFLQNKPDSIIAYHVDPSLASGKFKIKAGLTCSGVDGFEVTFYGQGAHSSTPEAGIDSIRGLVYFTDTLYQIFNSKTYKGVVFAIGECSGGTSPNIIAKSAMIKGTLRSLDSKLRKKALKVIQALIKETKKKFKVKIEFKIISSYPPVYNNEKLTKKVICFMKDNFLKNSVVKMKKPLMLGEDFAFYHEVAPSCLYFVGTADNPKNPVALHTPHFDIDEASLFHSAFLQTLIALNIVQYF